MFKDLYSKVKENKNDLEKFKQDQSKKCDDHRKDGHDRLEKVEKKIDDGFSNLGKQNRNPNKSFNRDIERKNNCGTI